MSCPAWEERVALYAGSDLAPAEAAELEAHLRACPGCADLARALQEDRDLVIAPPAENATFDYAGLRRGIRGRIVRETRRRRLWFALAAAAVLAAAIGIGALQRIGSTVPPSPLAIAPAIPPAPLRLSAPPVSRPVRRPAPRVEPKAALAAIGPPVELPDAPDVLRVPTRDPSVVILWVPEIKGENHE